jgi:hypothetical protein
MVVLAMVLFAFMVVVVFNTLVCCQIIHWLLPYYWLPTGNLSVDAPAHLTTSVASQRKAWCSEEKLNAKGCWRFFYFHIWMLPNLPKYSYGWSPLKQTSQNWRKTHSTNSLFHGLEFHTVSKFCLLLQFQWFLRKRLWKFRKRILKNLYSFQSRQSQGLNFFSSHIF